MIRCLLMILLAGCLLPAAERAQRPRTRKLWLASVAALIGANAIDIHSSWGHPEWNPVLESADRRFGPRAIGIKVGIVTSVLALQYLTLRKAPHAPRSFTIVNFASAGALGAVAARNYRSHPALTPGEGLRLPAREP